MLTRQNPFCIMTHPVGQRSMLNSRCRQFKRTGLANDVGNIFVGAWKAKSEYDQEIPHSHTADQSMAP